MVPSTAEGAAVRSGEDRLDLLIGEEGDDLTLEALRLDGQYPLVERRALRRRPWRDGTRGAAPRRRQSCRPIPGKDRHSTEKEGHRVDRSIALGVAFDRVGIPRKDVLMRTSRPQSAS